MKTKEQILYRISNAKKGLDNLEGNPYLVELFKEIEEWIEGREQYTVVTSEWGEYSHLIKRSDLEEYNDTGVLPAYIDNDMGFRAGELELYLE